MKPADFIITLLLLAVSYAQAQDTIPQKNKFTISGYVKSLEGAAFTDNPDELTSINIVHNRMNLKWRPSAAFEVRAELRTRLFWGDQVRNDPALADRLDKENKLMDLSWVLADYKSLLLHTTLDRASLRWKFHKWEVTAGRQRVNWGITTTWNPNDIFNAFNYFDFDYEERPGTDAIKVQYYMNTLAGFELAVSPGKTTNETVAGLLYRFNRKGYDIQFMAGSWKENWVAGGGWAGGIKDWGFKGEFSYFHPHRSFSDTTGILGFSIAADRTLKHNNYVVLSALYNSNGTSTASNFALLPTRELSARELMPFMFSALVQGTHLFTPICSGSIGIIYSPSGNSLIILPAFAYSLSNNSAVDIVGQFFCTTINNTYRTAGNAVYLRVRYDF